MKDETKEELTNLFTDNIATTIGVNNLIIWKDFIDFDKLLERDVWLTTSNIKPAR